MTGKQLIREQIKMVLKSVKEQPDNINIIAMWNSHLDGFLTSLLYTDSISSSDYMFYANIIRKLYFKQLDLA